MYMKLEWLGTVSCLAVVQQVMLTCLSCILMKSYIQWDIVLKLKSGVV